MKYTFFEKTYDEKSILPVLKEKIEFLQYEQKQNIKQLKDLITPLTQLVEKLEEIGFSETEDEKKQRQNYSVILKEKSNQSLEEFSANRAKNCESFDALIKGVERDVATLKMGNLAVKKIFDLIDNYVNNKRVSMLKSLIEQMQYYVDNEDYGKCYDCYAIAFEKFAK